MLTIFKIAAFSLADTANGNNPNNEFGKRFIAYFGLNKFNCAHLSQLQNAQSLDQVMEYIENDLV